MGLFDESAQRCLGLVNDWYKIPVFVDELLFLRLDYLLVRILKPLFDVGYLELGRLRTSFELRVI